GASLIQESLSFMARSVNFLKRRQFQHAADLVPHATHMARNRDPDPCPVRRARYAIEAKVSERPAADQPHAAHRHYRAILSHAHDSIVATVRRVEVGLHVESGIGGPVGSARLNRSRGQVHRLVQRLRPYTAHPRHMKHYTIVCEVNGYYRILERLAYI